MFCTNCGNKLEAQWSHCANCGQAAGTVAGHSTQVEASTTPAPAERIISPAMWVFIGIIAVAIFAVFSITSSNKATDSVEQPQQTQTTQQPTQQREKSCNWEVQPNVNYIPGSNTAGFNNQYEKVWICR